MACVRLILRNKRRYAGYLAHLSVVFLFVGYSGSAFKKTKKYEFHYVKLAPFPGDPSVQYYSGDKAYLENYEIQATHLFLRPVFDEGVDTSDRTNMTFSQEGHYNVHHGLSAISRRDVPVRTRDTSPRDFANRPVSLGGRMLKLLTGIVTDGRMRTERHFHPQIIPQTGELLRGPGNIARRIPTSEPDIQSSWNEDIYIQLGALQDPETGRTPELSHLYEFYYYDTEKNEDAYRRIFPDRMTATLEVWINPLVKFIWLGSVLFFLSGLIILVPFGEISDKKPPPAEELVATSQKK